MEALRVLAGLGLALVSEPDAAGAVAAAIDRAARAGSAPIAAGSTAPAPGPDERLQRCLDLIDETGGSPAARLAVATVLAGLADPDRKTDLQQRIGVLLAQRRGDGTLADLRTAVLPGGPPGLVPDPARMSLFTAGPAFAESVEQAWAQSRAGEIRGTVLWSLEAADGPIPYVQGASLGAAFAVLLDESRRAATTLGRLRVRRLRPGTAITGGLGGHGELTTVGGYPSKLDAAGQGRVIVPSCDESEARRAAGDAHVVTADTWRTAARRARRYDSRALARVVAAVATILALVAFAGIQVLRTREAAAELSAALTRQADRVRPLDPAVAGLLSASAWTVTQTPEARYGMRAVLATGLRQVIAPAGYRAGLALHPDGRLLGFSVEGGIRLWDLRTGRPGELLALDGGLPESAAFAPRGDVLVAVAHGDSLCRWTLATGARTCADGLAAPVLPFAISPDSRTVATIDQARKVHLVDLDTWAAAELPVVAGTTVNAVTFGPDGTLYAALSLVGGDSAIQAFTASTWRPTGRPLPNTREIRRLAVSPDGRRLAASDAADVTTLVGLWDLPAGKLIGDLEHDGHVHDLAFGPGGGPLAVADDAGRLHLWNARTGERLLPPVQAHREGAWAVEFGPDGRTLFTSAADATIRRWDVATALPVATATVPAGPPAYGPPITSVAMATGGGSAAIGTANATAYLWRADGGLTPLPAPAAAVALGPDGKTLLTAGTKLSRWDLPAAATSRELPGSEGTRQVVLSRDGTLAAGADDGGQVTVWRLPSGERLQPSLRSPAGGRPLAMAFSADGDALAASGAESAWVWDTGTGGFRTEPFPFGARAAAVALSADGGRLAVSVPAGAQKAVQIWDTAAGRQDGGALTGADALTAAAFSPDGTVLVTADELRRVTTWDLPTRRQLGPTYTAPDAVSGLAFSPDGGTLALTSGHTLFLRAAGFPADLVKQICSAAGQPLTADEWRHYVPGTEYRQACDG
ncbi:WD40 repeat domain-containing protein [Nonomuraea sp. MG754425]|uniref:WD40 repeat domain-containing protein n=1 Tax=Nonomuraea sp. MG754425 TaxID=2570319 RepID=UPI001F24AA7F|nr:WD40 repeat domain-containing protein [Nonomuraea sp. MG754425]MCF6471765.1 WD40 repeat domain-containing protein [Nonomuraea sp. MG754425]